MMNEQVRDLQTVGFKNYGSFTFKCCLYDRSQIYKSVKNYEFFYISVTKD